MWLFSRYLTITNSGISNGFVDYHSHLLPGVDDGIQTEEESLEALAYFEQLGVKTIWLTPHIMDDYPNTSEYLKSCLHKLKAAYVGKIELQLAAEYMLDGLFEKRLEKNDLLPLGENGNHLLVETSLFNPPAELYHILERIKSNGYFPVLAHPERYNYMTDKDYFKLKAMGIKFQLNLIALSGAYGKEVKEKAKKLLKNELYEIAGSDIHNLGTHIKYMEAKITNISKNKFIAIFAKQKY